jgi:hypothetical protein
MHNWWRINNFNVLKINAKTCKQKQLNSFIIIRKIKHLNTFITSINKIINEF